MPHSLGLLRAVSTRSSRNKTSPSLTRRCRKVASYNPTSSPGCAAGPPPPRTVRHYIIISAQRHLGPSELTRRGFISPSWFHFKSPLLETTAQPLSPPTALLSLDSEEYDKLKRRCCRRSLRWEKKERRRGRHCGSQSAKSHRKLRIKRGLSTFRRAAPSSRKGAVKSRRFSTRDAPKTVRRNSTPTRYAVVLLQ